MVESGIEEISATTADTHSIKRMDSDATIPSMSCGYYRKALRMVITQAHRINCHHVNPL